MSSPVAVVDNPPIAEAKPVLTDSSHRSYQGICDLRGDFNRLSAALEANQKLYDKGSLTFTQLFLNMTGAMNPQYAKTIVDTLNADAEKDSVPISLEMICFLCWFSVESTADVVGLGDKPFMVAGPKVLMDRFAQYWDVKNNGDFNRKEVEVMTKFVISENYTFVDRRAALGGLRQKIDLPDSFIFYMFDNPNLALFGASESNNTIAAMRSYCSTFWGGGEKNDNTLIAKKLQTILSAIDSAATANDVLHSLNDMGPIESLFGNLKGRPGSFLTQLLKLPKLANQPDEEFAEWKKKYIRTATKKLTESLRSYSEKTAADLLTYIELQLSTTFRGPSSNKLNVVANRLGPFAEMMQQAWGKISSARSNALNQVAEKFKYLNSLEEFDANFGEAYQDYQLVLKQYVNHQKIACNVDDYTIRLQTANGFAAVMKAWRDISQNPKSDNIDDFVKEVIDYARNEFDGKLIFSFYDFVIKNHEWLRDDEIALKAIPACVINLDIEQRFSRLKLHAILHFSNQHHCRPWFGESRPGVKFIYQQREFNYASNKEECKELASLKLEIYNGETFEYLDIPIHAARAVREVFFKNTDNEVRRLVSRNHPLAGGAHIKSPRNVDLLGKDGTVIDEQSCGVQLYCNNDRWYVNFSVKVYHPKQQYKTIKNDLVLGIDFGVRIPAAYGLIAKTENKNHIPLKVWNNKTSKEETTKYTFSLVEQGTIDVPQINNNSRALTVDEVEKYNEFLMLLSTGGPDWWLNKLLSTESYIARSNSLLVKALFSRLRMKSSPMSMNSLKSAFIRLMSLVYPQALYSTQYRTNYEQSRDVGQLSSVRLENFLSLNKLASSILETLKNEDDEDENFQSILSMIVTVTQNKFNNIRKERYRLLANRICKMVIDSGATVLALENMDSLRTSKVNYRSKNRMISSFEHRRIVELLEHHVKLLGNVRIIKTSSYGTSQQDLDGEVRPILRKYKLNELSEYDRKLLTRRFRYATKTRGKPQQVKFDYNKALCNLLDANNCVNFDELHAKFIKSGNDDFYIPDYKGFYCQSKYVDSYCLVDHVSATCIAINGMSRLEQFSSGSKD